jgi:hypothetical protein
VLAARLTAIGTIIVSLLLYWAAAAPGDAQAYLFPKLIALGMAVLGVAMLVRNWSPIAAEGDTPSSVPWSRLWPALIIFVLYLVLAQRLGFYITSWLAFVTIGIVYSPAETSVVGAKRCFPVSVAFLSVLYLVFVLLLQVQTPRGVLF